jgi:hypothetical protein
MKLMRLFAATAALIAGALALPAPAEAQVRRCLVSAVSAPASATYDPFNPTALSINSLSITFTRSNGSGGAKPSTIDMYVQSNNSAANGTQLIPVSVVGAGSATGLNQNIFYNTPGAVPNITVPLGNTPAPGVLRWDYSGNNTDSDVFTVTFNVLLPPNLDLTASTNIVFNIEYGCNGTGGGPQFSERAQAPNAFTLSITVLSALQASYVGSSLAFGEVGDKTTAQVVGAPATYSTPSTGNHIRVASSGPYQVTAVSTNGYKLRFAGGTPGNPAQELGYRAHFLGQTLSSAAPTFTATTCARAGLGGENLPIRATLLEGGVGKQTANYSDTITVTVAPLVTAGASLDCDAISLPAL